MKRFLIAAMALATIVSCSKDDGVVKLDSSKKSVELTIVNGGGGTRAITNASGSESFECAAVADLTVLFADQAGKVVTSKALSNADNTEAATTPNSEGLTPTTYTFHRLPEIVQQVAVIALRGNDIPATISDAETLWKTPTPNAEVKDIVVFGKSGQMIQNGNCLVDGDTQYPLFEGSVRVAPAHTRFEVLSIQCYNLGINEYGYSKITLESMSYNNAYTQELNKVLASDDDLATAGDGKVWSWNWIAPVTPANLVVNMEVEGKNYTVAIPKKTLTVTGYNGANGAITSFDAENIYKLTIPFSEADIDSTDAYICVDVDVTIAKWVINTITPVFGNN